MGIVFLASLILILYILLIIYFFESSKKMDCLNKEIVELKAKVKNPTLDMTASEALDALKAEIAENNAKRAAEEAAFKDAEAEQKAKESASEEHNA